MLISNVFCSFLIFGIISNIECYSYSDGIALFANLTGNYNKNVRPKLDLSQPTTVTVRLFLKSISGLDEVNGILTTVVSLSLSWYDDTLKWDSWRYGGIWEFRINENSIWVPQFIISNPAKKLTQFGLGNSPITIYYNGQVNFEVGDVLQTTCDVDVTYFPFDTQTCIIEMLPYGYKSDIAIDLGTNAIDLIVYAENNIWILNSTSSENALLGDNPYAKLSINLKRRYAFFIMNLFSPVVIMAFLNAMVFVLPADSGERVGYAITCLLALSVYMTFASESLPVSSKPIAVIIYVLLLYILLSTIMCVEVIIGLRMHLRDDSKPPPHCLARLFCVSCRKSNSRSNSVAVFNVEKEKELYLGEEEEEEEITWKQVARRFDLICFISNVLIMAGLAAGYIIIVKQ